MLVFDKLANTGGINLCYSSAAIDDCVLCISCMRTRILQKFWSLNEILKYIGQFYPVHPIIEFGAPVCNLSGTYQVFKQMESDTLASYKMDLFVAACSLYITASGRTNVIIIHKIIQHQSEVIQCIFL